MSTSILATIQINDGAPQERPTSVHLMRRPTPIPNRMSNESSNTAGALRDPVQRRRALNLAARFHHTSHASFVPQTITVTPNFVVIPQGEHTIVDNMPSHLPQTAAIYQGSASEEPQNRWYDVDVSRFLEHWSRESQINKAAGYNSGVSINENAESMRLSPRSAHIRARDLQGSQLDMQGFDWASLGTTRACARAARSKYCSIVHCNPARSTVNHAQDRLLASPVDLFRFRRMNTRHRAWIQHFALRNSLSVASNDDVLYISKQQVHRTDALGNDTVAVMDLASLGHPQIATPDCFSTIDASSGIVVAASHCGQYAMTSLSASRGTEPIAGLVNTSESEICHAELYRRRGQSWAGTVAFASNDKTVRLLDCGSNKFIHKFSYDHAINSTSVDPHGQMRLVAGDSTTAYVTAADSGEILHELTHHTANIYATSWSEDGIHLATASEDYRVLVYDARNWRQPIADIACKNASPRSLKFSPLGRGAPALLIAEAEDLVSVVDTTVGMFDRKQNIDFFGTIAGIDWRPDGRAFWIANADAHFGGLMEFERNSIHFSEAAVVGSGLEARNECSRAKQRDREVMAQRRLQHQRKRSSWEISSSPEPSDSVQAIKKNKWRSLQVAPSSSSSAAAPQQDEHTSWGQGGLVEGAEPSSPREQYIQRIKRIRTRTRTSRIGLGRRLL